VHFLRVRTENSGDFHNGEFYAYEILLINLFDALSAKENSACAKITICSSYIGYTL